MELFVKERMAENATRSKLRTEIKRQQTAQSSKPFLQMQGARDILIKLSYDIKESIRFLKLLHKKYVIYRRQLIRSTLSAPQPVTEIADFSATASPITASPQEQKNKKKSMFHSAMLNPHSTLSGLLLQWNYSISHMFRLLVYTAVLMKQCALTCNEEMGKQSPSYFSEEGIAEHMEANTEYYEFQCFHSIYVDDSSAQRSIEDEALPSSETVITPTAIEKKTPNIQCVKQFLDLAENYALDMILLGWSYFHRVDKILPKETPTVPSAAAGPPLWGQSTGHENTSPRMRRSITQQVASLTKQNIELTSPITPFLDILINGYYNRTVSLVGRCVWSFEKFETVRSKLELIHFVVTADSRLAQSIVNALGVIGLQLTPSPTLSLTLHLDDLLDELPIILYSEIETLLAQSVRTSKLEGDTSHFPWTIRRLRGSLFVGPLPDSAYSVLATYMKLMAGLPGSGSYTSHDDGRREETRLRRMNDIIAIQSLKGYGILVTAFEGVLMSLKQIVDTKSYTNSLRKQEWEEGTEDNVEDELRQDPEFQPSLGSDAYASFICSSDDVSSILYFLCSICNDCERICSSHLHLLSGRVLHPSNEFRAELHKAESDLSYIGWTTAELITKLIFYDAEEAFSCSFESVWLVQASPLIAAMDTLNAYMADLQRFLTAEYLRKVVISCGRKLIHRYFIMLYAHGSEMAEYNKRIEREVLQKPKLSSLLNRIPTFGFRRLEDQKALQMEREEREMLEVRSQRVVFDMIHIQQIREDVERIATFCARTAKSVSPFQNSELSAQFDQINVSCVAVWSIIKKSALCEYLYYV
jgi:hypothetical protein